ncbi:MAG: NAD(P)H-dependent flavin oxidoreductase, partial [Armatimonadota bacterium]
IRGNVWPGAFSRARRNALIREWAGREWELRQRRPQVEADMMAARAAGDVDWAILFYGQDAGLIHAIEPAGEIVTRMVREAHEVIARQASGLLEPTAGQREV